MKDIDDRLQTSISTKSTKLQSTLGEVLLPMEIDIRTIVSASENGFLDPSFLLLYLGFSIPIQSNTTKERLGALIEKIQDSKVNGDDKMRTFPSVEIRNSHFVAIHVIPSMTNTRFIYTEEFKTFFYEVRFNAYMCFTSACYRIPLHISIRVC